MGTPLAHYLSQPCEASAIGWQRCSPLGSSEALGYCPEPSPPLNNLLSETVVLECALFH